MSSVSFKWFGFSQPEGVNSSLTSKEVNLDDPQDPRGRTRCLVEYVAAGLIVFIIAALCIVGYHQFGNLGYGEMWEAIGIEAAGIFGFILLKSIYDLAPAILEAYGTHACSKIENLSL